MERETTIKDVLGPKIFSPDKREGRKEENGMAEGNVFLDKRAHSRVLVKLPVTFKVLDEKLNDKARHSMGEPQRDAESWDTSLGGMYIISKEPLKSKDHLSLKISLPKSENPLIVLADVVWADKSGAGLRFVAMKEEDVQLLEAYLKDLSPED